jgi:hypothetical protein
MLIICRAWAVLLILTLGSSLSWGAEAVQPFPYSDINTAVSGHPGLVYFDLLAQLVPDLVPNETIASGTQMMPVRHVLGAQAGRDKDARIPDKITFGAFQTRIGQFEGKRRILILTPIGPVDAPEAPALLIADRSQIDKLSDLTARRF